MEQTDTRSESRFQRWRSLGFLILGRCPRLAVNAAPLALTRNPSWSPSPLVSIGRQVGSPCFHCTWTKSSRILASLSGRLSRHTYWVRRLHVRSALARWRLCSRLQRLLL